MIKFRSISIIAMLIATVMLLSAFLVSCNIDTPTGDTPDTGDTPGTDDTPSTGEDPDDGTEDPDLDGGRDPIGGNDGSSGSIGGGDNSGDGNGDSGNSGNNGGGTSHICTEASREVVETVATCTEEGISYIQYYCSECGINLGRTPNNYTASLGHDFQGNDCTRCTVKLSDCLTIVPHWEIPDAYTVMGGYNSAVMGSVLYIPDTYNGFPVIAIGGSAFADKTDITKVVLGKNVRDIGMSAFSGCTSLTEVVYSDNTIVEIGARAFMNCTSLISAYVDGKIGEYAFSGCTALVQLTLGANITEIGNRALSDLPKLVEIYDLTGGSSADIYELSSLIEKAAYVHTSKNSESKLTVDENGFIFTEIDGINYLIGYQGAMKDIKLPLRGAYAVYKYAFYKYPLTSVVIPEGVFEIGQVAFEYCNELVSVTFPESLKIIERNAFAETKISSVSLPGGLEFIANNSFGSCPNLSYNVYENVNYLGNRENPYLAAIRAVATDLTEYNINPKTRLLGYNSFYGINNCESITIPDSVKFICHNAFYYAKIKTIDFGKGLQYIGDYAFDTASLTELVIPDNVTYIGTRAFNSCQDLASVTIGKGIGEIPNGAFKNSGLFKIEIPANILKIGDEAFAECSYLTEVTLSEGLIEIGKMAFMNDLRITDLVIPDTTVSIGLNAFRYCNMKSLHLGKSVSDFSFEISSYDYIVKITISEGNTSYKVVDDVIYSFDGKTLHKYLATGRTEYTVLEGTETIGGYAFQESLGLERVILPDSVKTLAEFAFYEAGSIKSIKMSNSLETIDRYAFSYCMNLESIVIPASVKYIGRGAFEATYCLDNATFEDADGWYYVNDDEPDDSGAVSSASLNSNAAYWLRDKYNYVYYKK